MNLESASADETRGIGRRLGALLAAGDVIALIGDLGAGKTQLTKGIAEGLGSQAMVTSPTFVLMNSYDARVPVRHYDLYRLDAVDLESLAYYDLRGASVSVIEWGEKAGDGLGDRLEVRLEVIAPERRRLTFAAVGERAKTLLRQLVE